MLTEHSAIVLPVIFRKSGLPPAVEVKHHCVMSDANRSLCYSFYFVPLSFYVCLILFISLYVPNLLTAMTNSLCKLSIACAKTPEHMQQK